ncbi:FAD/NAD(P)-binding domain-containing protein [Rhizodiscina lignyota]|uniref:FAD/NAD(P)-binding domain-containing protein n=1 Tax=Rhizodiscina lignyota TaxID=1504668 RepID=A0A9P4IA56_9PEZI|nr:FAD/NAD(P)-binding domain-containing protein [Rhizodiscina lignyota]
MASPPTPSAIIVGAGPSGIALAHTLKCRLGFDNFEVFEKLEGVGGTWRRNTYPGCGCDVPSHLYSFSFNLNPNWSKELCEQNEILEYMEATVDKFNLRPHFKCGVSCIGAQWMSESNTWLVQLKDMKTGLAFSRSATIFVSAVGGISEPRNVEFPGMDTFNGRIFHTAQWEHGYDYKGKRMAVIGNGCSAAQVIPAVQPKVLKVTQYARSPQWYHERPNRAFTSFEKLCFKYVPFVQRCLRLRLFLDSDSLAKTYGSTEASKEHRAGVEQHAKEYIYKMTPKEYHDFIVPEFPLGCKRRIFDPDYLKTLHCKNVELIPEGIKRIDPTGIVSDSGIHEEFDVIVLATGFQVQNFLATIELVGKNGEKIHRQWDKHRGAQAYLGTYVHNFPNFAILFGPNTFPAHNSVIYSSEVQVEYIAKTLFAPIIDHRARTIEVKAAAEEQFAVEMDEQLKLSGAVFSAGCSNWYINSAGRNSASWPGKAAHFWYATWVPQWKSYTLSGGDYTWFLRRLYRYAKAGAMSKLGVVGVLFAGMIMAQQKMPFVYPERFLDTFQNFLSSVSSSSVRLV